jgi:hypothetical protein
MSIETLPNSLLIVYILMLNLRRATALHQALVLWYIASPFLFTLSIAAPALGEGVEVCFHEGRENFTVILLLNACDEVIKNPGSGDKLCLS